MKTRRQAKILELFYFATKKIGVGRGAVAATTAVGETIFYCRNDESAVILDFMG